MYVNKLCENLRMAVVKRLVQGFSATPSIGLLGAMGRRIDPSWGGPIKLFLVPASAPRLV